MVEVSIWKIELLWWIMKIFPILMRKKTRETTLARIGNGNFGRKWCMMKKSRDHKRPINIIAHMDSNLVWQTDSRLFYSVYLNVLQ